MIVLGKSPLEKLPPRKFSPIKLPPRKFISEISHPENSYLEYSHPFYCLSSLNISFKTGGESVHVHSPSWTKNFDITRTN